MIEGLVQVMKFNLLSAGLVSVLAFAGCVRERTQPYRVSVSPGDSLVAVRDRVRAVPASNRTYGVEVILPTGSYALERTLELDARDSGTPEAPVVWRAECPPKGRPGADEGRLPQIVAGIDLLPSAFRQVSDPKLLARLDPSARGKVLEVDITKLRFKWPDPNAPAREIHVPLALPDLFVGGRRMAVATFPSEGWCEMTRIVDRGTEFGDRSLEKAIEMGVVKREDIHGGTFGYAEDRPSRWADCPHVAIQAFWRYDWRETVIYAKSIDPVAKTITLLAPHSFGLGKGNPAPRRWRAINVFEELVAPGRYAVDFAARRLYVYPPAEFASAGVGVCAMQEPTVRVKGAHDIVFDGLHFGRSSGYGLAVADSARIAVRRCLFTDARDNALRTSGSTRTSVRTCDFHRLGGGGVEVNDGDRRTLSRGDSVIEDCLFHHWNGLKSGSYAAAANGVGNAIRHCEMRDCSHQAASMRGNDCVFEYNVLSNICTGTDDAGAFYKGCDPSMRGNVLRYNYFRNIGRRDVKGAHGACSIYFDDGDGGDLVFGCVFEDASVAGYGGFGAVFSHGGYSNVVRNCIFTNCSRPLGSGPWTQDRWAKFLNEGKTSDSLRVRHSILETVDITKPPFTTHYPELAGFMDPQPDECRWNAAYDNAFVNCPLRLPAADGKLTRSGLVAGRWYTNETSVVFSGDPGFVDASRRDYRLRDDSQIYRKIPNFKPIPFGKIGLLTPEGRRRTGVE